MPMHLTVVLPATSAGNALRVVIHAPHFNFEIVGMVVTDQTGITANATNFATIAAEIGATPRVACTTTTATVSFAAGVPRRVAPTETEANRRGVPDDPIAVNITKAASGVATNVNLAVTIEYIWGYSQVAT